MENDLPPVKSTTMAWRVSGAMPRKRLAKFHGVSKEKFPLYLKEIEFRYNNRSKNIFNLTVQNLCSLVPDLL